MAEEEQPPALTEPVIIPCLFLTGIGIEPGAGFIRLVGWTQMPDFGGDLIERRIGMRVTLPMEAARELATNLRKALARGGH